MEDRRQSFLISAEREQLIKRIMTRYIEQLTAIGTKDLEYMDKHKAITLKEAVERERERRDKWKIEKNY